MEFRMLRHHLLLGALAGLALSGCRQEIQYVEVPIEAGCSCPDGGGGSCGVDGARPDTASAPDTTQRPDTSVLPDTSGQDLTGQDSNLPDTASAPDTSGGVDTGPCVPQCDGRICGGNGCGGTCGTPCPAGQVCVNAGTRCSGGGQAYQHAAEDKHSLARVLDLRGPYGVALAGGHLLASNASGGSGFPRETPLASSGSVDIPGGARVRHALLWVSSVVFLKPHDNGQGDYTADLGGALDSLQDIQGNGVSLSVDGTEHGPYDTSARQAPAQSAVGSETQMSPVIYDPHYGTMTGLKQAVWANRIDVTGLFEGKSGSVAIRVDPPERLDVNGNNASANGGNPAGSTLYNLCNGAASWSLLVIYEKTSLPHKNLVLMDGAWARAWDYLFFHSGSWQRPLIAIDHAPIKSGAKLYLYAASGTAAGNALPTSPTCSCGCGGTYMMAGSGMIRNDYFSDTLVDPVACQSDPLHRDSSNGPWYLQMTSMYTPVAGNEWTLFRSADTFTEFPNLYEGNSAPGADSVTPFTDEDDPDPAGEVYDGHPWDGRGVVTYHGFGNAVSVVEIALDDATIAIDEERSYIYLKGDQKDVWKPQQAVSLKYVLFETPL